MSAVTTWSLTPSDNNSAPPNGWPEGQAAASVNNCARQMMADLAREFQVNAVKVLASVAGTNTITGSLTPDLASYSAGMLVILTPANNNTGATTLNIDSLGALDIQKADGDALVSGDLVAGIPALLVLDSGADDWILLNPQTFNGVGATLSGNLSVAGTLTVNGSLITDNTSAEEPGFKGLPQNAQGGSYTAVLDDAGRQIYSTAGSTTLTIPSNASVAYPIGTVLTFIANGSAGNRTIAITSDTLFLAGVGTTGSRTLAPFGMATAVKILSTSWLISGSGLS
jgi:hypothetical protein